MLIDLYFFYLENEKYSTLLVSNLMFYIIQYKKGIYPIKLLFDLVLFPAVISIPFGVKGFMLAAGLLSSL